MQIREILKRKGVEVWGVKAHQTLYDVLKILVDRKIGALLVSDDKDKVVGIISERDVIRACYDHPKDFDQIRVEQEMTIKVVIAKPTDKIEYVMAVMTNNRVRHVPILDKGKLEGLVSIGDVVKACLEDSTDENKYLKDYMFYH